MKQYKNIIYKFLQEHEFTEENRHILGVLFYGSRHYNTNKSNSDIDLLIVTDSSKNYKGADYIDDIKIEYFEKNIYYLLEKLDELDESFDRSLVSILKNGQIIFSKGQTLEYLKEEVLSKKSIYRKRSNNNHKLLNEWYYCFRNMSKDNNFFDYVFHNLIEQIRKAYHEEKGYSKIPIMKTYDLYSDEEYATKYYCVILPKQWFKEMYLDLVSKPFDKEKFQTLISQVNYNIDTVDSNYYKTYNQSELKYKSTIVENDVSKAINYLQDNHLARLHYYYMALDRVRVLYCNINDIDSNINKFEDSYDDHFLELFNNCLTQSDKISNLKNLYKYVSEPIDINYKRYRVLELTK